MQKNTLMPFGTVGSNPFGMFGDLEREMSQLVNWPGFTRSPIWGEKGTLPTTFGPACEVEETDEHYLLSFDLPGVDQKDIKVDLKENQLTISGERRSEKRSKNGESQYSEKTYGSFHRSFTVPRTIKSEQIEASFENGVLNVVLPKTNGESNQPIKIESGKGNLFKKLLGKDNKRED